MFLESSPGGQVWLFCSGPLIELSCLALSPKAQFQTSVQGWLRLASQTCLEHTKASVLRKLQKRDLGGWPAAVERGGAQAEAPAL